jgi:hypothetical protein
MHTEGLTIVAGSSASRRVRKVTVDGLNAIENLLTQKFQIAIHSITEGENGEVRGVLVLPEEEGGVAMCTRDGRGLNVMIEVVIRDSVKIDLNKELPMRSLT